MDNKILAQLEQYRLYSTPVSLSWKQHWVHTQLSNDYFFKLSEKEKYDNINRFKESEITLCNNITCKCGEIKTIYDILKIIINPVYKNINKKNRPVIFSSRTGNRPIGEEAWIQWNGFQVIDLDIKDKELAQKLKKIIFDKLYKFNWFIGVIFSSSGKGLHIYTKIAIPERDKMNINAIKLLYTANFRHKYSFVYLAIKSAIHTLKISKDDILKWMDLAMFKPQQGAFIGYDSDPYISSHYFEDFIYVGYELEDSTIDWLTYPDLVEIFNRWEWFETSEDIPEIEIINKGTINNIHNKKHYKHKDRWRLANTLVNLYGEKAGYTALRQICTDDIPDKELLADCKTAKVHAKSIDSWAINLLNKYHGFKIKANVTQVSIEDENIFSIMSNIPNPLIVRESKSLINLTLTAKQYLTDISAEILNNLEHITLLEAGPGLGKTELIKNLVKNNKKHILLVMPFISTIKAKTENEENWEYAYANKKVNLNTQSLGLCITMDKFSKLNIQDIAINNYDYIVIDESHLMFQSAYRPIMSNIINIIIHSEIPVILMSGTPSGETSFFPDAAHIYVHKVDKRQKVFNVNIVNNIDDLPYWLGKHMANEIANGHKIFFPTNRGTKYFNQVIMMINQFMEIDHGRTNYSVNAAYYKKANLGEQWMDDINFKKTIGKLEVIGCSQYMSVGVDILDKYTFSIFIAEGGMDYFMPQEILQFANRLRNRDLIINYFVARNDNKGNSRYIYNYKPLSFELDIDEKKDILSIIKICNNALIRAANTYKYNIILNKIIAANEYIKYDLEKNIYFLDETHLKIIKWEENYRKYVQQLPIIMRGMKAYDFKISSVNLGNITECLNDKLYNMLKTKQKTTTILYNKNINNTITNIVDNLTPDLLILYREILQGIYTLKKGKNWNVNTDNKEITYNDIETFSKILPYIISFSKSFNCDKIKYIINLCKINDIYNWTMLNRFRTLNNIITAAKKESLAIPIKDFMEKCYIFISGKVLKKDINKFINNYVKNFIIEETLLSNPKINLEKSPITIKKITTIFKDLFYCLVNISTSNGKFKISKAELPQNEDIKEKEPDWLNLFLYNTLL